MKTTIDDLITRYGLIGLHKQHHFGEIIKDLDWQIDLEEGLIYFGEEAKFNIEVIGSESYVTNTWLWGWANKYSELPEKSLKLVNRVKEFGIKNNIKELYEESFEINNDLNGFNLSLVSMGIVNSNAIYSCEIGEGDGKAFFFIKDNKISPLNKNDYPIIFKNLMESIGVFRLKNPYQEYSNYFDDLKLPTIKEGRKISVVKNRLF